MTTGDHLRKARLDAGLCQKNVAELIGVSICTITNWELNRGEPEIRFIPAIIKFLGYNPRPEPEGTLERLEWYRWTNGLSIERLGIVMKRDPEQLSDWLSGRHKPFRKSLDKIATFLNSKE
ncbi:helix-turn-helix domain-containing protein [Geobacter sp.]|uniref:helix-turn-helix domain-containing protein n=1 Tax=Geobacter sp. TaxID=46610 RepID=UPI0035A0E03D